MKETTTRESAPYSVDTLLRLYSSAPLTFTSPERPSRSGRLFGGEVAGQAVIAACRTVPADRALHALHAHFLRPGDAACPVTYHVRAARDGGSFSTRTVDATQKGRAIFTMTASFHTPEQGVVHQTTLSDAPGPEEIPSALQSLADEPVTQRWIAGVMSRIAVDLRFPDAGTHGDGPTKRAWMRTTEPLRAERAVHAAAVVYLSDLLMISAALVLHPVRIDDVGMQFATLNHSVWLHAPLWSDQWFLYELDSDWAADGRALIHGRIFDGTGRLCATTAQESLVRRR